MHIFNAKKTINSLQKAAVRYQTQNPKMNAVTFHSLVLAS